MTKKPELHFYDAEDRPWPNPRLTSASILGHVSANSIRIWVRAREPGTYHLLVSSTPIDFPAEGLYVDGGKLKNAKDLTVAFAAHKLELTFDTDITGVADVKGLEPDTTYHYALINLGREGVKRWELGYEERLTFRTDPKKHDELAFGLISCHMPYRGLDLLNMDMFDSLRRELEDSRARMLLAAGDQVYVDGNPNVDIWSWLRKVKGDKPTDDDMISWYRDIYRGYWGMLPMRRVLRAFPTYMIWDDHEIMDGWGSYTKGELSNQLDTMWEWENKNKNIALAHRMFEAAKHVYAEYQHSHNPPTPEGQWDYAFDCKPAASFYVLDMRGQRDYTKPDGERILGPAQMKRVKSWLKTAPGDVLFIVSPVPMVHASSFVVNHFDLSMLGIADDLRDEWEHESNWTERNELLRAVFERSSGKEGKRIVFLSGDVHIAGAFKLYHQKYPDARVHQLTSSGITYAALSEMMRRGLRLTVSDYGALGDVKGTKDPNKFHFRTLHTYHRNHFAMIRVTGERTVSFDVYGANEETGAVTKLRRIEL